MFKYLQDIHERRDFAFQSNYDIMDNITSYQNASAEAARRGQLEELLSQYATQPLTSAAHFGLATGLLLALVANTRLPLKTKSLKERSTTQRHTEAAFALVSLVCAASLAPLLTLALLALALYRHFVCAMLASRSPAFAGLLDGTDAVWALEDSASRSIINVLAVFEVEVADHDFQPPLIHMLRRLIQERILDAPDDYPKFWLHRRRSSFGYFYWEQQDTVDIEQHVQYMTQEDAVVVALDEDDDEEEEEYRVYGMSESVLKELLSELANSPLPCDDAASWEVLVGRDPILEDGVADPVAAMEEGASSKWRRFPVLLRVHHAMGDGVALIKLLLDTLADQGLSSEVVVSTHATECSNTSLIESVDMIPCHAGQVLPRPEPRSAVEIPKVVVSTVTMPLAIAVGTPEYEIEKLFLSEDSPQPESFVVIDDALDGADAIYFRKEGVSSDKRPPTITRCESPVPPFAHVPRGRASPAPRVVAAVPKSVAPCADAGPPQRFESPVPKIHRKKYPCLAGRDSSASSSDELPTPRDIFAAGRVRCGSPFSRRGTPLPRNDDPVPRCNSPVPGATPLPLSRLARLRNHSPAADDDLQNPLDSVQASGLRRRRSFNADEAIKLGEDIANSRPEASDPKSTTAAKPQRAKARHGSSSSDNRYMRLLESTFHRPSLHETLATYVLEALSLVFAPATLIHQTLARRADANALHGRRLSGEKLVTWSSDVVGESTLDVVRRVKKVTGASFTDVLLSAVSASLHEHFSDVAGDVPEAVSVVIPARMPSSERDAKTKRLENNFSVAILTLPVDLKSRSPLERLKEVAKHTAQLRKSPDYLVNFWLMKVLAKYLPLPLLAPLLESTQSTLVVSNLPGPRKPVMLAGYKMTDLAFWVPNRGSTGLGVSILSYAGRLHFGLVADCSLVGNQQQADSLLGEVLSEIRALSALSTQSST